jgi:hypothetical protein
VVLAWSNNNPDSSTSPRGGPSGNADNGDQAITRLQGGFQDNGLVGKENAMMSAEHVMAQIAQQAPANLETMRQMPDVQTMITGV